MNLNCKQANIFSGFPICQCSSEEDHESGASPCRSADHWCFALSNIRQTLFNNTACFVPSPAMHLIAYEKKLQKSRNTYNGHLRLAGHICNIPYSFNTDPLNSPDIFSYRRSRSEHLLIRMLHFFSPYKSSHSFVRLSTGVFLIQKFEQHEPIHSYSTNHLANAIDFFSQEQSYAPVETFSFNDLFHDMIQQTTTQEKQQQKNTFIPYTYTLGLRYTNPYNGMKDILVSGNIPLWCQTLFITECMRILPIQHGSVRKGIFPFAKEMEFRFTSLQDTDPCPDLLIMFERFAMEISEPHMMLDIPPNEISIWKQRQSAILSGVLFCNIDDKTAHRITQLAEQWANEQGIPVH